MPRVHASAGYGNEEVLRHNTLLCAGREAFLRDNPPQSHVRLRVCWVTASPAKKAKSRQREANDSESSTAERSARTATRRVYGRDRQFRVQPGDEVSD